ncbi:MAG: hypothetical protein HYV63_05650 [Candidatus Schekmanbacteria bacterium]|nr:hypothetical protein [Candidatus Schekmanbacteria bacterium]
MKKVKGHPPSVAEIPEDEILPEYDFSHARPNKYAETYAKGTIVVTLDPDVAAVFPDASSANAALRSLADLIRTHAKKRRSA